MLRTRSVALHEIQPPTVASRRRTYQLVLRHADGSYPYEVVTGHDKYEVAVRSGTPRLFCWIREADPEDPLDHLAEIRGVGGRDAIEEADAVRAAIDVTGMTQSELARTIGMSQSQVSKRLSLLDLSPRDAQRLRNGVITLNEALGILQVRRPRRHQRTSLVCRVQLA